MNVLEKVARVLYVGADESYLSNANGAINTFLVTAAKQGWHMRPDEATEHMKEAGWNTQMPQPWEEPHFKMSEVWKGMTIAAPEFEWKK